MSQDTFQLLHVYHKRHSILKNIPFIHIVIYVVVLPIPTYGISRVIGKIPEGDNLVQQPLGIATFSSVCINFLNTQSTLKNM
ncbi:hypothetical protein ACQP3F_31135, partial [Escherichia coli]